MTKRDNSWIGNTWAHRPYYRGPHGTALPQRSDERYGSEEIAVRAPHQPPPSVDSRLWRGIFIFYAALVCVAVYGAIWMGVRSLL